MDREDVEREIAYKLANIDGEAYPFDSHFDMARAAYKIVSEHVAGEYREMQREFPNQDGNA